MTDFITKFHNLNGDLPNERKKNFFKLLEETTLNCNQSLIDSQIQNLHPKNYLEELFWLETLIRFKKSGPLLELLKTGNREYVKIILRQPWFIKDVFNNVDATDLVDNFFPTISYSTRLKLLRRISIYWGDAKADTLFDCVQKRYGTYIALNVLHSCSIAKIQNILEQNEIVFNAYQVSHILNRSEELLKFYIHYYNDLRKVPYAEKSITNLLANKNPDLFIALLRTKKITVEKLTRAGSIKVINAAKEELYENPELFLGILNTRALVKALKKNFVKLYEKIFPKKFGEIQDACTAVTILKYLPKAIRWGIFNTHFEANFIDKETNDLFEIFYESIVTLNPGKEIIQAWAEANYKLKNDEIYLQYYPISTAVKILKEKINVTSDKAKRQALVTLLLSTCAESKDMEMLSQIMDYIASRHKNEDPYTYRKIIESICNKFTDQLSKNHWDFIRQQVVLIRTKGVITLYDYKGIAEKLIVYAYKNDRDLFEAECKEYVIGVSTDRISYRLYVNDPKLEIDVFKQFCRIFPTVITPTHKYFNENLMNIMSDFYSICDQKPEHCLNLLEFPYFVSSIENILKKNVGQPFKYHDERILKYAVLYHLNFPQYSLPFFNAEKIVELLNRISLTAPPNAFYGEIITSIVEKPKLTDTQEKILTRFLSQENIDVTGYWHIERIVTLLLKHHPRHLVGHFEKVYSKSNSAFFVKSIKCYSHLGFDKQLCALAKKNWLQQISHYRKIFLEILQDLLTDEEFIEFLNEYVLPPASSLTNEHKSHAIGLLTKASCPSKCLSIAVKICEEKDFLPDALRPLYSLFSRSPENVLRPHIEGMLNGPLLRKHGVFLSCQLLDYASICSLLSTSASTGSLCTAGLKYFARNPSEELFVVALKHLESISRDDKRVFSILVKIKLPRMYRARYIEACWKILENLNDEEMKVNKHLDKLLEQLIDEEILQSISNSFINNVVNRYMPIEGKNRLKNIDKLILFCLKLKPDSSETLFSLMSKLNKSVIRAFCSAFVDFVYEYKPEAHFISTFMQNWNKQFPLTDSINEHVVFNLLLRRCVARGTEDYAKSAAEYLEKLILELGPLIFDVFKTNFRDLLGRMPDEASKYEVLYAMLKYKQSAATYVLVIQLLELERTSRENDESLKSAYNRITEILGACDEVIVKSYYEIYLRNMEE
ncbi:unnamed protein product [Phyllotreta striolata]|uniref:Uncharacterized protein n=1 Tax=Phyllotreta striolata TaxID=444603 RepID=A0A9N9TTC1_PHYSR|nr:unnamed protein product [Phyllotreta striolata]